VTKYKKVFSQGVPFAFRRWYGHGSNFGWGGTPFGGKKINDFP